MSRFLLSVLLAGLLFAGNAGAGSYTNGTLGAATATSLALGGCTLGSNTLCAAGTISDSAGNLRSIPQSGSDKVTGYTLQTTDNGQFIGVGTSGSITIPDATFATGNVVTIFNNTSGNITITCTITTAYIAGTDADKATMTLATRGLATLLFLSGTVVVVNGNVS